MKFSEELFFKDLCDDMIMDGFLKEVIYRYHYMESDEPELYAVASAMQDVIRNEAAFDCTPRPDKRSGDDTWLWQGMQPAKDQLPFVVMTLGAGVDTLQDFYIAEGKLTESFMVEALAGELLMKAYSSFNKWLAENTKYYVANYIFLGSEKGYPLEDLPKYLEGSSLSILCNECYYMIPKKSVAFFIRLTKDAGVRCPGICESCKRKDCPNKTKAERLLPYGYAKILGRDYL